MELEHRIIKLELRVENHEVDLKELQNISNALKTSLAGIEKTLAQIKWLATGAVVAIVGQSMGIDKVLKLFL
jgi:uncharacterized coiled-coil protein SlyX